MTVESASNISQLDSANPGSLAPAGEGDDHLRLIKEVLLASFPALDGLISNSAADGTAGNVDPPDAATFSRLFTNSAAAFEQKVPVGGIIMWAGLDADIPAGWQLCDGSNGAPDLRNRFILGSASESGLYLTNSNGGDTWDGSGAFPVLKTTESPDPENTVNGDTGATNVQSNDRLHGHWYLPPFYSLAYIQYKGV